jgi:hypothetical protein
VWSIRVEQEPNQRPDKVPRRTGPTIPSHLRDEKRPDYPCPPSNLALVPSPCCLSLYSPLTGAAPASADAACSPELRLPEYALPAEVRRRQAPTPLPPPLPSPWSPDAVSARPPRPRPPRGPPPPPNCGSRCRPFAPLYVPSRDFCSPLINPRFLGWRLIGDPGRDVVLLRFDPWTDLSAGLVNLFLECDCPCRGISVWE